MLRIFYFTEQYVVLNCDVTKTILATDVNYCTFQAIHCRAGHATILTVATSTTRQCKRTSVTYDEKRKFISPWCKTGVATTCLATRQHKRQFCGPIIWSYCRDSCRECPALDSHVITSFKATARSLLPWGLNCSISKSVHIRQSVCLSCAFSIYISRPRVSWRPI